MNFYAFQYTDGTNTTTTKDGRMVTAGRLYKFPSKEYRDAWVNEGVGYRNGPAPFRVAVTTRDLPHGWRTSDATEGVDYMEAARVEAVLERISPDGWLSDEFDEHGSHWAHATNAPMADWFTRDLKTAIASNNKARLSLLKQLEKVSVRNNCEAAKAAVRRAVVCDSWTDYDEHIAEARRLWGAYGDDSEISAIEHIIRPETDDEDDEVWCC